MSAHFGLIAYDIRMLWTVLIDLARLNFLAIFLRQIRLLAILVILGPDHDLLLTLVVVVVILGRWPFVVHLGRGWHLTHAPLFIGAKAIVRCFGFEILVV